jgi:ABC-type dipeptide/oligopeptide/nickel transport system permease component
MIQKTLLLLIIFAVSIIMAIAFGFLNYKYKKRFIDYYVMFLIGVGWTILGLLFKILSLGIMGVGFAILGYVKRKDWDEDLTGMRKANRDELTLLREQTDSLELAFTLLIFLGILILLGVIIYMYLVKFNFSGA